MNRTVRYIIAILVIPALLSSCRKAEQPALHTAKSGARQVMGTFAHITAVADSDRTAKKSIEAAFDRLTAIDKMMSDYIPDSELSTVNRDAFKQPVKVSDPLFEILTTAIEYSQISDGAFDVTIGPVVDLWRNAKKNNVKPTEEQIAQAKQKVGCEKLILDPSEKTVKFAVDGMRLDLGAIAKGYAIDKAIEAMKQTGATAGIVDVGGDLRCFGKPQNKPKWRIGLQNPQTDGDLLMVIELDNTAIATSGDYRRFVLLDGEKFSHIMIPEQGVSAKDFSSVSVIAPTAIAADALATTLTVIGTEKGIKLIESLESTEALLIPSDPKQEITFTSGLKDYIKTDK